MIKLTQVYARPKLFYWASFFVCLFFVTEEILRITARLQTREFGQDLESLSSKFKIWSIISVFIAGHPPFGAPFLFQLCAQVTKFRTDTLKSIYTKIKSVKLYSFDMESL